MPAQQWAVSTLGGYLSNNELSKRMRFVSQPSMKFRQFVEWKNAKGSNKGDKLYYDKAQNIQTQGGTLVETNTMPESYFPTQQGTLTITEYGNSVPWTHKLEKLAELDVNSTIVQTLRNDMAKTLDSGAAAQFTSASWKYVCYGTATSSITTNGTFTASATSDINAYHVRNIVKYFHVNNIQPYANGDYYICIASPQALDGMHGDTGTGGWVDVSKYTQHVDQVFAGEVGNYHMTRFIRETNVLSNNIGSGTAFGEAVFFGADAVAEGVAEPEHLRAKIPADFGRDQALAWYFLGGWQKIWSESVDGEERIIHVKSA